METTDENTQELALKPQISITVENVLAQCRKEGINVYSPTTVKEYLQRPHTFTGIPRQYLQPTDTTEEPMAVNLETQLMIRQALAKLYSKKEHNIRTLYNALPNTNLECKLTFELFKKILTALNYTNIKTKQGNILIEDPKITFARDLYIKKVLKARAEGIKIYYLSLHTYDKENFCMVPYNRDHKKSSRTDELLLYHLLSRNGYENSLYSYNDYEPDHLFKWVLNVLKPILQPSSLVVVVNVPKNETTSAEPVPTKFHPKADMMKWLRSHGVPFTPKMIKAELFQLIEMYTPKLKTDSLDHILKSLGHEVIHLSKELAPLSITGYFWQDVNKYLFIDLKGDNVTVKNYLSKKLGSTVDLLKWYCFDEQLQSMEKAFFDLDLRLEQMLDSFELDYDSCLFS